MDNYESFFYKQTLNRQLNDILNRQIKEISIVKENRLHSFYFKSNTNCWIRIDVILTFEVEKALSCVFRNMQNVNAQFPMDYAITYVYRIV